MNINEKFELIKRNTQEIVAEKELINLLEKKKNPSGYIGLASTGKIHVGYFIPMLKVADFLNAGFKFKILLADVHAHLDDRKAPFDLLDKRVKYYEKAVKAMMKSLNTNTKNLEFVKGSDFQLEKNYTLDMYRLSAINTFAKCKKAAAGVVRFGENPKLSGFIYPILQALDEEYLDVDVQYGGIDQRKILMFARENLPKIGYKPRIEVMTPMLPGLTGEKMSSSVEKSKIDLLDSEKTINKKINSAFCPEKQKEDNGVLAFATHVIMTLKQDANKTLDIERPEKFGGNVSFSSAKELEEAYLTGKLHPMDLKTIVAKEINNLLEPVRKELIGNEKLIQEAFPI